VTAPKRRSLQIDDPLAPTQPAGTTGPSTESATASPGASRNGAVERERKPPAHEAPGRVWRTWSGVTGVGSFRLPHELLIELGDQARELQLPIGMIVTAAITQLLDQPPDTIATLVDRADDARIQGRRRARRHRTESAGD